MIRPSPALLLTLAALGAPAAAAAPPPAAPATDTKSTDAPDRATAQPASPHGGTALARCDACHTTSDWRRIRDDATFDHSRTGFPLVGRHAQVACSACHGRKLVFSGTPAACTECHADRHRGALGPVCSRCHDERGWEPDPRFLAHRETRFPLAGAHAVADCTACHVRGRQETFRGTPTACVACHDEDRRRPGMHPNHLTAAFRDTCESCHSMYSWFPARLRHDLFFPLRGTHQSLDCFRCHEGGRYGGTPSRCYACHARDYAATQDPPHARQQLDQRCEKCHTDLTWRPARSWWHDRFFRISSGDHAGLRCAQCHYDGLNPQTFSCIRCHGKSATDGAHQLIPGYAWENFRCYGCHADSGGED